MEITKKHIRKKSNLSFIFIIIGLFFLPFNSYDGIPVFGEFSRDSCVIFFLLASISAGFELLLNKKLKVPYRNPIYIMLSIILIWFFLTLFFNIIDIKDYYLKNTSGLERFISQYVALLISAALFLLTYYQVFSKYDIRKIFFLIRKVFLASFMVVSFYTFIEIAIIYLGITQLEPLLRLFDYFPFCDVWLDFKFGRISSVTYEPPAFASYLMTIAGWMFSYIITSGKIKSFIPSILVVLFAFLSGSRSGLAVILFQLLIFLLYFIKRRSYHGKLIKIGLLLFLLGIPIIIFNGKVFGEYIVNKIESFELDNSKHSTSNRSRFGMIYTSSIVFLKNPIKGVGFGQVAYESRPLYPSWATDNNWEFRDKYLNDNYEPFPPSYNLYTRILAETGIIGFGGLSVFLFVIFYVCYQKIRPPNKDSWMFLILLISFAGYAINWLQIDTFRVYGFWICLALLLILTKGQLSFGKKKNYNG